MQIIERCSKSIVIFCEWSRGMFAYVGKSEDRESPGFAVWSYAYVIAYE